LSFTFRHVFTRKWNGSPRNNAAR